MKHQTFREHLAVFINGQMAVQAHDHYGHMTWITLPTLLADDDGYRPPTDDDAMVPLATLQRRYPMYNRDILEDILLQVNGDVDMALELLS